MRGEHSPYSPRPRPVAGVPIAALGDGERIAKAWLLAVVAEAPLHAVAGIPAADLAREAPTLCAAIVRALGSDAELARMETEGDLAGVAARVGTLAGASDGAGTTRAVELLRGAAWSELRAELVPSDPAAAELADRLAHVLATVAETALSVPARGSADPLISLEGVIEARELRVQPVETAEPDAPWTEALERRIEHGGNVPLAVLAVEVDDLERLLAADADEATSALERAEHAIAGVLRPGDTLHRELPGRWWLVLPDTEPGEARTLAESVAAAASTVDVSHDAPLTVSMGIAMWPQDGSDAGALVDHADTGVFAARAAGVRLA